MGIPPILFGFSEYHQLVFSGSAASDFVRIIRNTIS